MSREMQKKRTLSMVLRPVLIFSVFYVVAYLLYIDEKKIIEMIITLVCINSVAVTVFYFLSFLRKKNSTKDTKWQVADLCIKSKILSAAEITKTLGIPPTKTHEIGDPFSLRSMNSKVREESHWELNSGCNENFDLEDQILAILSMLEQHKEQLFELHNHCDIFIFCGFSSTNGQGAFELSPTTSRQLADLCLTLVLDLYPPEA